MPEAAIMKSRNSERALDRMSHSEAQHDVYSIRLDRAFVVQQCLAVCSKRTPNVLEPDIQVESPPIEALSTWLATGSYFTPAQIHRRGVANRGRTIARRLSMQAAMNDTSLGSLMSYWLQLTHSLHRPFRCAALMILFAAMHETLKLVSSGTSTSDKTLLDIVRFAWVQGLKRAGSDMDIYVRAFALKMTGICCELFPAVFWNSDSARLLAHGACARSKTVRSAALTQMIDLVRSSEVSFEAIDDVAIPGIWAQVLTLHTSKPSQYSCKSQTTLLTALAALYERRDFAASPPSFQALLLQSVREQQPIAVIAAVMKIELLRDKSDENFRSISQALLDLGGDRLDALGEACGNADAEFCTSRFAMCIRQWDLNEFPLDPIARLACGLAKTLNDDQLLKLVEAFQSITTSERRAALYLIKVLGLIKNRDCDSYREKVSTFIHGFLRSRELSDAELLLTNAA